VHWDGRAWARIQLPGSSRILFSDVAALAPDDVWVVGDAILHWDGSRWTSQSARELSRQDDSWLAAVDAVSATDVWAVGSIGEWNPIGWEEDRDLVLHWDGSSWSTVASLKDTTGYPMYGRGLDAIASGQAWTIATPVMGSMLLGHWSSDAAQPESLGWRNGSDPMTGNAHQSEVGSVGDVVALSPDDVWTAGAGGSLTHWDGTTWEGVGPAGELTVDDVWHLTALARSGATDVWAVGDGIVAHLSC
jgi:hypothetical protein